MEEKMMKQVPILNKDHDLIDILHLPHGSEFIRNIASRPRRYNPRVILIENKNKESI
ncbi:hypothetical protein [Paenibacillus sp. FSL L8-0709]|uniref:hypothetical protein n=1 Tax=Paenibacillus sp. FSL L8-0709 TaxID=2975312 RepID=UPI0030F78134